MKRYILVLFSAGYNGEGAYAPSILKFNTDDVAATVRKLAEDGHDLGVSLDDDDAVEQESLDEAMTSLNETGHWDVGDGAWALTLIDTQNPDEFEEEGE